jgi:hypothetical protein
VAEPRDLFAQVDELEVREAQLEAALERGQATAEALQELQRVRLELSFFLETLEDMGAFNPPDGGPGEGERANS